ncbi:MAG TPA: hypothetical protein VGM03_09030 [Phycisphaerae bacterium]|jgi:hypothetical protein
MFKKWVPILILAVSTASTTRANIVVSLRTNSSSSETLSTPVRAGGVLIADIYLAATPDESPLQNLRLIQFDFRGVEPNMEVLEFRWMIDQVVSDPGMYFVDPADPDKLPNFAERPSIGYFGLQRIDGQILDLTTTPVRVAMVTFRVNSAGTFDVLNSISSDGEALMTAGFGDPPSDYTVNARNLTGGTAAITLGTNPVTNNNSTTGGTGTVRNPAANRPCGIGFASILLTACALLTLSQRRRRL